MFISILDINQKLAKYPKMSGFYVLPKLLTLFFSFDVVKAN